MGPPPSRRWARCPPHLAWKKPGLPTDWVPVLDRHPKGVKGLPGYVWLDMPGKVRSIGEHELEFTEVPRSNCHPS
jgi:hypothetical protein